MNVDRMGVYEGEPPTPDVAGAGEIVCPCGYFRMETTSASPGLGLMMGCPHCGRNLESWVKPGDTT